MSAEAFLAISDLKDARAEIVDELELETVAGDICSTYDARVDGQDVVLICSKMEHCDAMRAIDVEICATYLGTGGDGNPRYYVTSTERIAC